MQVSVVIGLPRFHLPVCPRLLHSALLSLSSFTFLIFTLQFAWLLSPLPSRWLLCVTLSAYQGKETFEHNRALKINFITEWAKHTHTHKHRRIEFQWKHTHKCINQFTLLIRWSGLMYKFGWFNLNLPRRSHGSLAIYMQCLDLDLLAFCHLVLIIYQSVMLLA